jgi:hypothetical protein
MPNSAFSQYPQYDKNYFLFPIKPGQQNFLAGTMGELRPNHFHGGLDIRTDQRTGLPVFASADGYISRIVVSSKGYGNTLYIIHPNGLMTVYAHLEWPYGKYGKYIKEILYKQQCNEIDFQLFPGELTVNKGDTIALSGNSGSSGGPHLHYEIRDNSERLLNPLFFNFPEIEDNMRPFVNKIAIRTMNIQSRVEGEFGRYEYIPVKEGSDYVLRFPIHAYGIVGIELVAYDHMNGSPNKCGLSLIEMKVDGKESFVHDIQTISFDDNPYINHHIDFEILKRKGNYFQKCYVADGNCLNTYCTPDALSGKLKIFDTLSHKIEIKLCDAYRNCSTLKFTIRGTPNFQPRSIGNTKYKVGSKHEIWENTLKVMVWGNPSKQAKFYLKNKIIDTKPSYTKNEEQIYLWDLRKGIPDSLQAGEIMHNFDFEELIPPFGLVNFSHKYLDIQFPKKALFDTLYLDIGFEEGIYSINEPTIALFSPLAVTLKPDSDVFNKPKTAVFNISGRNSFRYSGGEWIGNNIKFRTKIMGDFILKTDTISPKLRFQKRVGNTLYFHVSDALSGISQWYAYLNGRFLLMHYDAKYDVIFTDLLDEESIKGTLLIGVLDNLGNKTQQVFYF